MVESTVPYFSMQPDVKFLIIKHHVADDPVWLGAFYVHVFSSCLLLPAGLTQFSTRFLRKNKKIHRFTGKLYLIVLLFFAGPSGFIMAFYANGGWSSQLSFVLAASFWIFFSVRAWQTVLKKDFVTHRDMMVRSFALTCSALTLRTWKFVLTHYVDMPPMDRYRLIAWLGWVPNLIIAELIIYNWRSKRKPAVY